ncbi:hypothetical protein ACH495_28770 [Micromonospora sp. NPDC018662]|uniref:hypothetical protein n=1 Tax=Micromonospora sp. NPDC018662 TaxID=3364238 RepID=UPI0037907E83
MTLVLSVQNRDTMWLMVDRRLSYGGRRSPQEDAVKVITLETTDGVALLGYAGLGATSLGTQPSDWMAHVLRGHEGLTLEHALGVLSGAANRQLPRHLAKMPGGAHFIIAPAFIRGIGPRLYGIENFVDRKTGRHRYSYTSYRRTADPGSPSIRLALGGTGGIYLARKSMAWQRTLLSLVKAHYRGKVSDYLVADQLAKLNYETHQGVRDGSVGPRSIVLWRRRPDPRRPASGGGHQFYNRVERDSEEAAVPIITNGLDVQSIVGLMLQQYRQRFADRGWTVGQPAATEEAEMKRLVEQLTWEPDERLR